MAISNLPSTIELYLQSIMDRVQSDYPGIGTVSNPNVAVTRNSGSANGGYWQYGDRYFEAVPNSLPNGVGVRARWDRFRYESYRNVGGGADAGSQGTLMYDIKVRVYGSCHADAQQECLYFIQSVKQDYPYPPISDIVARPLTQGRAETSSPTDPSRNRETIEMTFTAPISLSKAITWGVQTILSASVSGSVSGSLQTPFSGSILKVIDLPTGSHF